MVSPRQPAHRQETAEIPRQPARRQETAETPRQPYLSLSYFTCPVLTPVLTSPDPYKNFTDFRQTLIDFTLEIKKFREDDHHAVTGYTIQIIYTWMVI